GAILRRPSDGRVWRQGVRAGRSVAVSIRTLDRFVGWRAAIRLACDETFVEFKEGRGARLRVQVLPDICPRRVAHGVSQVLVVREGRNLMGHLHRIPRQGSGSSTLDQLSLRRAGRYGGGER